MTTRRLESFSDGVFAVAITFLAFGLVVPAHASRGALWRALGHEWPSFAAYVVSFLVIAIVWLNHHRVLDLTDALNRRLYFANFSLLLFVVAIPFATALLAQYLIEGGANAAIAAALYSGLMAAMSVSFVWLYVGAGGVARLPTRRAKRVAILRFGAGVPMYLAFVGLSFVSAPATLGGQFLLACYYLFTQVTPAPSDPDAPASPG